MQTGDTLQPKKLLYTQYKSILIICLVVLSVALLYFFQKTRKWDDEFIIFRYANNVALGNGWTFNPNTNINGCTTVLYTLILAIFGKLGLDIPTMGYFISLSCLSGCAILTFYLLDRNGFRLAAWYSPFLLLAHPILQRSTGMETSLYLMLALFSLIFYFQNRITLTTLFLGLCVLTRPDAILLAAIIFLHYIYTLRKIPYYQICLFIFVLLPWMIYSQIKFGSILPNTLAAKALQGGTYLEPLWSNRVMHWIAFPIPVMWVRPVILYKACMGIFLLVLLAGFCRFLFRNRNTSKLTYKYGFTRILLLWGVLHSVGYIYLHIPTYYEWHMSPVVLIYCILGGIGFEALYYFVKRPLAIPIVTVLFLLIWIPEIKIGSDENKNDSNIKSRGIFYVEAGKWFKENTPVSSTIGAGEIGILGYYSGRTIIDGVGLVTPGVAQHNAEKIFTWYIRYYRPEYVVNFDPPNINSDVPIHNLWGMKAYLPIKEIIIPNAPRKLVIYKKINDSAIPEANVRLTPLMTAVTKRQPNIVKELLDVSTADIDYKDIEGQTPLIKAIANRDTEISKILIAYGADINIPSNNFGYTPLMVASKYSNTEIVQILLEKGANPNLKDIMGNSPLLIAAWEGYPNIVKLLISTKSTDINIKNNNNMTPIQCALLKGHSDIVKLLHIAGAKE